MNELALFAGAGGGVLASQLLGWSTVCAVEIEDYARRVLMQRQDDGILEPFPIWDDIKTFDGKAWAGTVDVISGGFPCQDISAAGRGAGLAGTRSGLWSEMHRIIGEVRPRFVFAENSPMLRTRGLGTIIQDLASLGYDVRWCVLGAWNIGANHKRNRMWILAHANGQRLEVWEGQFGNNGEEQQTFVRKGWWQSEPAVGRLANGVANRVDRLKALGNGQVPAVAATAFEILSAGLTNQHQESDTQE